MKKGFTLIELLAVIVILAIIALIATPIVLNIINDTKESATLRSANFYLDAVEYAISTSILKGNLIEDGTYDILETGNICIGTLENKVCKGDILEVKVNGQKPNGDKITIKDGQIVSHVIKFGDVIIKNEDSGPEKNQYGFYYNVPYVAKIDGYGTAAFVFYEDNTVNLFDDVMLQEKAGFDSAALFYIGGSSFTYDEATRTATPESGEVVTFSEDGSSLVCNGVTFVATGEAHGVYYDFDYVSEEGNVITFSKDGTVQSIYNGQTFNGSGVVWSEKDHFGQVDSGVFISIDGNTLSYDGVIFWRSGQDGIILKVNHKLGNSAENPASPKNWHDGGITFSGVVLTNSGVQSVTVNGVEATVNDNGYWECDVPVDPDEGDVFEFVFVATDLGGNTALISGFIKFIPS